MKRIYYILTSTLILSCTNASEDDLVDTFLLPTIVDYDSHVKPIIDDNCIVCHNNPPINFAPMSLLTFNDVKNAVENNNLIGRIATQDLGLIMPSGGPQVTTKLN